MYLGSLPPVVGRYTPSFLFILLEEGDKMDEPLSSAGGGGWMCFFMSKPPQSTHCPRSPGQQAPVRLLENCCFKGGGCPVLANA